LKGVKVILPEGEPAHEFLHRATGMMAITESIVTMEKIVKANRK
jgi:hypothetical protein